MHGFVYFTSFSRSGNFKRKKKLEGLDDVIWQYTDKTCSDYIATIIFSHTNVTFKVLFMHPSGVRRARLKAIMGQIWPPPLSLTTCALDSSETLLFFFFRCVFADFCRLGLPVMISWRHLIVLGQKSLCKLRL